MRRLIAGLALACVAGTSLAQEELIECWYDEQRVSTGADKAPDGAKAGETRQNIQGGDYAWSLVISGADTSACPEKLPEKPSTGN